MNKCTFSETRAARWTARSILRLGLAFWLISGAVWWVTASESGERFEIGHGHRPASDTDTFGNHVIAWHDPEHGILIQGFDTFGQEAGEPQVVAAGTAELGRPDVAFLPTGEFMVIWEEEGRGVLGQLKQGFGNGGDASSFGTDVGEPIELREAGSHAAITANDRGEFILTWNERIAGRDDLPEPSHAYRHFVERIDRFGLCLAARASFGAAGKATTAAVSVQSGGDFMVAWENTNHNISAQIFDRDTNPIDRPIQMSRQGNGKRSSPQLATALDGTYAVVWEEESSVRGNQRAVFAEKVSSFGLCLAARLQLASIDSETPALPSVAADQRGKIFVAWTAANGAGRDLVGQEITLDGQPEGPPLHLDSSTSLTAPAVTPGNAFSDFLVVWEGEALEDSQHHGDGDTCIFGRHVMLPE